MTNIYHRYTCVAPKEEREKCYVVWNGKSDSYLAKSQMQNVTVSAGSMTFTTTEWYASKHPWLIQID